MPKKRQSEQHGPLDECAYEEWAPGGKGGPLRIVMGPNVLRVWSRPPARTTTTSWSTT